MVITFEGLPCSYKTSAVNYLAKRNNTDIINEFVTDDSGHITPEKCIINDLRKSRIAHVLDLRTTGVVLMDRSYMSTIVYEHTASKERGSKVKERYGKLLAVGELAEPDAVIYLDITAKTCVKRAKLSNRYNAVYEWFHKPALALEYYKQILSEYSGPIATIKVDNIDRATAMGIIADTVDQLEHQYYV